MSRATPRASKKPKLTASGVRPSARDSSAPTRRLRKPQITPPPLLACRGPRPLLALQLLTHPNLGCCGPDRRPVPEAPRPGWSPRARAARPSMSRHSSEMAVRATHFPPGWRPMYSPVGHVLRRSSMRPTAIARLLHIRRDRIRWRGARRSRSGTALRWPGRGPPQRCGRRLRSLTVLVPRRPPPSRGPPPSMPPTSMLPHSRDRDRRGPSSQAPLNGYRLRTSPNQLRASAAG